MTVVRTCALSKIDPNLGSSDAEICGKIIDREFNVNKGMLYEDAISQMLVASGRRLLSSLGIICRLSLY